MDIQVMRENSYAAEDDIVLSIPNATAAQVAAYSLVDFIKIDDDNFQVVRSVVAHQPLSDTLMIYVL